MLGWCAASRSRHHTLDCPGKSSFEEKPSLTADPAEDAARATSRDTKLTLVRGDAGSGAELERVRRKLDRNIPTKESWAETQEMSPLVRHGPD